jgi:hypothetical protein
VSSLSAFRGKLERDRVRAGLSVARLSWQLSVSVREYRELVEGGCPSLGLSIFAVFYGFTFGCFAKPLNLP